MKAATKTYRNVKIETTVSNQRNPRMGRDGVTYYTFDVELRYYPSEGDHYYCQIKDLVEKFEKGAESEDAAIIKSLGYAETLLDDIWEYQESKYFQNPDFI